MPWLLIVLLFSSTLSFIHGQEARRINVQPYLVRGGTRSVWTLDTHRQVMATSWRRKRSLDDTVRIVLDGKLGETFFSLNLQPRGRHPVTSDTIIEWVDEDGQRTMWRAEDMAHCWYSGHVEHQNDSTVWLGICDGLSGYIRYGNETLLLEPDSDDPRHLNHVLYSPLIPGTNIVLDHDQEFGELRTGRNKRDIRSLQIDYDEEGNEVTDTIQLEDLPDYQLSEEEEEEEEDNLIDDEDSVMQIRDYDVHPPVDVVTEEIVAITTDSSTQEPSPVSEDDKDNEVQPDFDGFNVDKLWEVPDDQLPQSGKRKKPVSAIKGVARVDPPKWLEMALAIDHTVIKFHGKQRVQQYVLTLLNIVSAIYEDTSLEASLQLVVSRLVFYEDRKSGQVREGNSKRSLENVNAWNSALLRNAAAERPHDIAVWLTRYELGGPSGYAPVAGVCDPDRSCSLNRDEGLTSAFIIAHEVGHVLGFSHDGDMAAGNDCSDEALQGSVMAPMVAATFSRFHWSRCTHWEYHFKQHNWKCLKNQPVNDNNITVIQSSIQYSYSLDEQCRMEFGEGYSLCRSFSLSDPCTHLWCGHRSSPQLCKTKKGPPLEGTPCAQDKWCIKGFCESIGKRKKNVGPVVKNPRDGSWGEWGPWTACSRTCGVGVRFRTRICDSPPPANGGRPCEGPGEDSELCSTQPCPQLNDFRAEQCPLIAQLNSMNVSAQSLTWLPFEMNNQSSQCHLTCVAVETGEVFHSKENVIDGTLCSYEDPHGICIQGKCQTLGCDKRLGSVARENDCGICNGKASDCSVANRHYSGSPRPPYRRVVVIPRGARNIRIREESNSTNQLALKTRISKEWILNSTFPMNRQTSDGLTTVHFIWSATRFTYVNDKRQESIRARGPLLADLTLMIVPGAGRQQANVTVTWSHVSKSHRKKNPAPDGGQEEGRYAWEMAGWSPCSRTCGEGSQTQIWYCRDRKTDHVVRRKHCMASQDEPIIATRLCNTFRCDFRWVTGEWEGCSRTCGADGTQMRLVYCVRTNMVNATAGSFNWEYGNKFAYFVDQNSTPHEARRHPEVSDENFERETSTVLEETVANPKVDTWKPTIKDFKRKIALENQVLVWHPNAITDPSLCRDQRPEEVQPCNRQPCPGVWVEKFWTKCSVSCGIGQQEMQFACLSKSKAKDRAVAAAAFTESSVTYEEEEDGETSIGQSAAGYSKRNGTNPLTKPFCGVRPSLVRQCKVTKCPEVDFTPCVREPVYCLLPFFQKYCIVPRFRKECCLTCAPNNDLPN